MSSVAELKIGGYMELLILLGIIALFLHIVEKTKGGVYVIGIPIIAVGLMVAALAAIRIVNQQIIEPINNHVVWPVRIYAKTHSFHKYRPGDVTAINEKGKKYLVERYRYTQEEINGLPSELRVSDCSKKEMNEDSGENGFVVTELTQNYYVPPYVPPTRYTTLLAWTPSNGPSWTPSSKPLEGYLAQRRPEFSEDMLEFIASPRSLLKMAADRFIPHDHQPATD